MTASPSRISRVPDWLRWRADVSPSALALKTGSVRWSFRELQEKVSALSATLVRRGLTKGQRVAILMRPSEGFIALVHAIARIGAVTVPLNDGQSISELVSQINDSEPSFVVYDELIGTDVKEVRSRLRLVVRGKRLTAMRWVVISTLMAESAKVAGESMAGGQVDASSTHAIIYTSGSSGAPKGVELTLSNLMWNAVSVGLMIGASAKDRWLVCMPLFHVGGYCIIFRSLLYGSGLVLQPKFDAIRASRSLDHDGITLVSFVPTMLSALLEVRLGRRLDSRVRYIFLGGGAPPKSLLKAVRELRLPVLLTYGMTETCSQVAVSDVGLSPTEPTYHALPPSELAVTRPRQKGRVAFSTPGEVGEVVVRGPTLFSGYWRNPRLTRSMYRGDWFLTGDLGVSVSGGLSILGRREETIVSGGEKILPFEVEQALREHAAVKDAVVVGLDDTRWGERVVAVVEMRPNDRGQKPSAQELGMFLKERVARYKIPKQFHFWDALPRTPTGKTRRGAVRKLLERDDGPT